MSKSTYECLDLLVLTVIASVIEGLNLYLFLHFRMTLPDGQYLYQVYTLSFACLFGMIAIFRWNYHGLVVAPVAGLVSALVRYSEVHDLTWNFWLSMTLGYLGLAVCLLFFVRKDKAKLRENLPMMILYFFAGFLAVEVCRSLFQIGSLDFVSILKSYFTFDLLNGVIGFLVYLIALRQKGLVTDMNQYLIDLNQEQKESKENGGLDMSRYSFSELTEPDDVNDAALLDGGMLTDEDLKKMEADRRKIEGTTSRFEEEREAVRNYHQRHKNKENQHESSTNSAESNGRRDTDH